MRALQSPAVPLWVARLGAEQSCCCIYSVPSFSGGAAQACSHLRSACYRTRPVLGSDGCLLQLGRVTCIYTGRNQCSIRAPDVMWRRETPMVIVAACMGSALELKIGLPCYIDNRIACSTLDVL